MLNLQACRLDDAYLSRTEQVVDIGPFQSADIMSCKRKMCHASTVHEELKATSILDETQLQAVNLVLNQRLAIIEVNMRTGDVRICTVNMFHCPSVVVALAKSRNATDPLYFHWYANIYKCSLA